MGSVYTVARKQGLKEVKQAIAEGKSPYPAVLDDIIKAQGKLPEISIGLVEIPLDQIVGTRTAGRTNSFSYRFMPILEPSTEFASKWDQLYLSQMEEGIRDPIKAYEYMTKFYVEEGNKRVSVSRYVGLTAIYAQVIRVMPKKSDTKEYRLYREFLEYFNVAGLYDITFSDEGSYKKFAKLLGRDLKDPWPKEVREDIKAAFSLFQQIYHQESMKRWTCLADGDAFLIYLQFYPLSSLLTEPRSLLSNRVGRLWNEFLVDSHDDNITLSETPEDTLDKDEPVINAIGSTIRDMLSNKEIYTRQNPLHAAFIYPKSADNSSWIYGHELGRSHVDTCFGGVVKTKKYENCGTNEEVRKAIDQAVEEEADMIFTISPTQMEETLRCAIHFPQVKFLNCSVNLSHNAVRSYYGRMYEAKFLMGALAASVATNHKIGYIADYPIYGIVAGINAFAIGAGMIDPKAKIHLKWSTDQESDWRSEFRDEGVFVVSGPEFIRPDNASREYGIYQTDLDGNVYNLAAPVWDWGTYYELIIKNVLTGNWDSGIQSSVDRATNYWWGMSAGVIDIILSGKLSYYSRKLVNMLRDDIITGRLNPFTGELHSQIGLVKGPQSRGLNSREIITMSWLNDNVIGALPKKTKLNREANEAVDVSGVEAVVNEEQEDTSSMAAAGTQVLGSKGDV